MLAFFTDPYPNELLISAITRYHHYIDNRKYRITNYELFGREELNGYYSLSLDYLVKKLGGTYSIEELINSHTIYPFYKYFNKYVEYYNRYMCIRKQLFFCPECARLDIEKYGETYFHREHQLDGISICSKHRIVLKKYGDGITWDNVVDYKIFDRSNVDLNNFQILDDSKYDKYWQISKLSFDLLSCKANHYINLNILSNYYKKVLYEKGFVSNYGVINLGSLKKEINNFYGDVVMSIIDKNYKIDKNVHWLNDILDETALHTQPINHLSLINFLGKNINEVISDIDKDYKPFGDGPWLCINTICNHHEKAIIKKVEVISENNLEEPYGIFECELCGFKYSRYLNPYGHDCKKHILKSGRRYEINEILDYGTLWYNTLKSYIINDNYSVNKISNIMKCSRGTVLAHAKKTNLENCIKIRRKVDKNTIKDYKQHCIELINSNPNISRTEIARTLNYKYLQILKHDKKWWEKNAPTKLRKIDKNVLENYKQQCIELINSNPNISRTELYSILKKRYIQILKHDRVWLDNNVPKYQRKKL